MNVSEAFSMLLKVRRIAVIVSIVAGAGYKAAPIVWHKAEGHVSNLARTNPQATVVTNADGIKISSCDLGSVLLTNHYDTCVSLGANRDCLVTPVRIDRNNVQLTVTVESKNERGKVQNLSITQVMAKPGKAVEVAVGEYSFSLTPNLSSE
jgi:hypothetical protein